MSFFGFPQIFSFIFDTLHLIAPKRSTLYGSMVTFAVFPLVNVSGILCMPQKTQTDKSNPK
jgi:hypothetical protein